ncbi:MAG: hypothetical protein ACODAE_08355 [Gemmatimonadota bacterium]
MSSKYEPTLGRARGIAAVFIILPVVLWSLGWLRAVRFPEQAGAFAGVDLTTATWVGLGIALPCLVAGLVLGRSAVGLADAAARGADDPVIAYQGRVRLQGRLVLAWTMFEAASFVSGVLYLYFGRAEFLWGGVAVLATGMLATYPRRRWYARLGGVTDG